MVIKATISHLAIVVTILALIILWFRGQVKCPVGILHAILLLYVITQLLALVFGENGQRSFWSTYERTQGFYNLLLWSLYACGLAVALHNEKRWRFYLNGIIAASSLVSFSALLYFYNFIEISNLNRDDRLGFSVGNAAVFGHYIAICLVLAIFSLSLHIERQLINKKDQANRLASILYIISIFLLGTTLLATGARGGLVALSLSLLVGYAFMYRSRKRNMKFITSYRLFFIGICVILGLSVLLAGDRFLERIEELSFSHHSIEGRLQSWQIGWLAFLEKPFLGWGPENFIVPFGLLSDPQQAWHESFDYAHNQIVETAVGSGFIGLGSYLVLLVYSLLVLSASTKNTQPLGSTSDQPGIMHGNPVALIILPSLLAYHIGAIFLFDSQPVNFLFYSALGYSLYLDTQNRPLEISRVVLPRLPVLGIAIVLTLLVFTAEFRFIQGARIMKQMLSENQWSLLLENFKTSTKVQMHGEEHLFQFSNQLWQKWPALNIEDKKLTRQILDQQAEALLMKGSPHWRSILSLGYAYLRTAVEYPDTYPRLIKIRFLLEEKAPNREDTHRFIALLFIGKRDYLSAKVTIENYLRLNPKASGLKKMLIQLDKKLNTSN